YVISLASIVSIVLNATVIVVLGSMRVNIVLMRFVALSSVFVRSFILYFYTKRRYKNISFSATPNVKALDKRWSALFLQILGVVQSSAPIVLLTIVFNKNMAIISVYSIFNMIIGGINGVLSIFVTGLSASFGDIIAKNEINTLQKSTREFEFAYYSLLTVVYSIAMVMLMPFIRIYTQGINDINYNLPIVGFLFVLNGLLYNVKTPQGMLVISAGHYKETRVQSTIQAVIIIVFGIILTPKLGLVGILIASCLSNLYRDIDLLFYIPKKVTNLPVKSTFFRIVCIFVSGGLICLPMFFININPLTFLEWFITAAVVGVYAVAVVLVIALIFERRELKNVYLRVLRLLPSSRKKD
ncbi:MAG: hypothetical protein RSC29_01875, partial [Oscillospiraceae bacterium]